MLHIHAVIRGTYWEARGKNSPMHVECRKAGWGFPAPRRHVGVAMYATKGAFYASKTRLIDYSSARLLNGGTKPWHWSQGYTGGVPMRDFMARNAPPKDLGPWRPVLVRDLPWFLRWAGQNPEAEAEKLWPIVEYATRRNAVYDAAIETIERRLNATPDPVTVALEDRKRAKKRGGNAFAGMPSPRWRASFENGGDEPRRGKTT